MKSEIRKEKVEKYGSFLFCTYKGCLCFGCYTDDGSCKYELCLLDNPKYIQKQAEIEQRIKENDLREREERKHKQENASAPIRIQRKTTKDLLEEQIKIKENYARRLYRTNKPKKGDSVMREIMILNAKLKKLEK